MSDGYPIQTNFTAGEVSPYILGRPDINRYANGAAILQNFIVKPQGGILRRSGTRFINEVKTSSKLTILRKFEFSISQTYELEFGQGYIRFYRSGGLLVNGGSPVEVATPYQEADLRQLYFIQSADVLFICHPSYYPRRLSRLSDISWTLDLVPNIDGPYKAVVESSNIRITPVTDTALATSAAAVFTVVSAKTITNVSAGPLGPMKITATGHGFVVNDTIAISGVLGALEANGDWVVFAVIDANNFQVKNTDFKSIPSLRTYISGGKAIKSSAVVGGYISYQDSNSVWSLARLQQVMSTTTAYVDIVDTIFKNPVTVSFTATYSTTVGGVNNYTIVASNAGVFTNQDVNKSIRINGSWYRISSFTDDSTVTGTSVATINSSADNTIVVSNRFQLSIIQTDAIAFDANDAGRLIRINLGGSQLPGVIYYIFSVGTPGINGVLTEGYADFGSTVITRDPTDVRRFVGDGLAIDWKLGAWSSVTGYPSVVFFHEQRLGFGSTSAEPDTLTMSKSSDYYNFAPTAYDSTVADDNAITVTIASGTVNQIMWVSSGPTLLIGTISSEWQIKASALDQALTPTNIQARLQTQYGSLQMQAVRVGTSTLFVQRSGQKIREMMYNFQFDQYEAKDLTVVSEHIIRLNGRAVDSTYQQEPSSLYWVVTDNGSLCCMTYQKEQEVVAWHNHPVGGNGFVESVVSVPSSAGIDILYLIVKRTINGTVKRYIEYMELEFAPVNAQDKNNMFFMDCGLSYSGSPVSAVSGLSHLEGQTVAVLGDGSARNNATVTGGSVNVSGAAASHISVGLPFTSLMKNLPIEAGSDSGTAQGKVKRIEKLTLRLLNSFGFKFGEDSTKLEQFTFTGDLYTGDKDRSYSGGYNKTATLYVVQDQPYPLTVLSVIPQMVTNR